MLLLNLCCEYNCRVMLGLVARKNCTGFEIRYGLISCAKLQRLAITLKFCIQQVYIVYFKEKNENCGDETARIACNKIS